MTPRRRLALLTAGLTVASMALWSGLGLNPASAERKPVLIKRVAHGFHHAEPSKPLFILALGSDQGAPRYKREGDLEDGRADSIHIIAINPERKAGTIIGIPRDTLVNAGGYSGKINGVMAAGGPERMVRVIEEWTSITLDYYMVTSFDGFEDMINELGGVVVDIPYKISDGRYSNAFFEPGPQVVGGYQALALARNRHDAPAGDFSRSENQGLIMLGALRRARAEAFNDPGVLLKYLRIFFTYVESDLTVDEALNLGLLATRIQMTDVRNVVIEGTIGSTEDGASVVRATEGSLAMMRDVAEDAIIDMPFENRKIVGQGPYLGRRNSPSPEPSPSDDGSPSPEPSDEPTDIFTPFPDDEPTPTPTP